MEIPRFNSPPPPSQPGGDGAPPGGRLNLLLSYAGWQPESWADRLPRLLEPMGVRSLRASSGRQASEVLRDNQVHIAVVDLGLPLNEGDPDSEEAGPRLLDLLLRLPEPPPTVVVKRSRTHRDACREMAAALRCGAFAVIDRPRDSSDLEILLGVLSRCLSRFYQGRWPGTA
jgi:DNA-binding response OmpR family regulator